MQKILIYLLCLALTAACIGCGTSVASDATEPSEVSAPSADRSALDALQTVWNALPEDSRFACYGGSQRTDPILNAPAAFDLSDKESLTYLYLVPESLQEQIADAATLVDSTDSTLFTGASYVVQGDAAEFGSQLLLAMQRNPYSELRPQAMTAIVCGSCVLVASGSTDHIEAFRNAALAALSGAVEIAAEENDVDITSDSTYNG